MTSSDNPWASSQITVVTIPEDYDESEFDESKGCNNKVLTIDYSKFVPYLIKMVQIQQKEITEATAYYFQTADGRKTEKGK